MAAGVPVARGVQHDRAGEAVPPDPSEHSARTLFASIKDQCTAVMNHTEAQAYQRGVQDSTQAKSAEDAGFEI
jgi:hypothetical protein